VSGPHPAIPKGLAWLRAAQLPTGELPSFASALDGGAPVWVPDQLNFITALGVIALAEIEHPEARAIVDAGVRFLLEEREGPGLWRYWSRSSAQVDTTPPDADDTACCSRAVAVRGHRTSGNVAVLKATAAPDGRFHTWLIPRERAGTLRTWWALRDERRAATRAMRDELWRTTEAELDDIDAVVNANVCNYLGPQPMTCAAAEWVASIVRSGDDSGDKWHRSPYALWAAVADGSRRGITAFSDLGPLLVERISGTVRADGTVGTSYETGLALSTLITFGAPDELCRAVGDGLLAQQHDDGSWPLDVCYHGGPREVFGWASAALTSAVALRALWRLGSPDGSAGARG
jgi:hypothetical protein